MPIILDLEYECVTFAEMERPPKSDPSISFLYGLSERDLLQNNNEKHRGIYPLKQKNK